MHGCIMLAASLRDPAMVGSVVVIGIIQISIRIIYQGIYRIIPTYGIHIDIIPRGSPQIYFAKRGHTHVVVIYKKIVCPILEFFLNSKISFGKIVRCPRLFPRFVICR